MAKEKAKFSAKWQQLKRKQSFRDGMLFLVFICISALFWLILAFNDNVQNSFIVKIEIANKPDSVTFISDLPDKFHVTVRDKGTNLWRTGILKKPVLPLDFREYADGGILRVTSSDLYNSLKSTFGENAQITSLSLDSLHLIYTTNPGKRVPIVISANIEPTSGFILEGEPTSVPGSVHVYGDRNILDTIHYVHTEPVKIRDISESTAINVNIKGIKGAKIIPAEVKLKVNIEPLVHKEALISISTVNVPENESLLLFPSKIPVSYFVVMSRLSDDEDENIELTVDYNEIEKNQSGKLHVKLIKFPDRLKNLSLEVDSVEYALVK